MARLRSCPEDHERLARLVLQHFGQVDVLISNVTSLDLYGSSAPDMAFWDAHYNVDLLGAIHLTELLLPSMRQRQAGAIVFVSSISGKLGEGSGHAYGAMKAALIAASDLAARPSRAGGCRSRSARKQPSPLRR